MFLTTLVLSFAIAETKPVTKAVSAAKTEAASAVDAAVPGEEVPAAPVVPTGKTYGASDFAAPTVKLAQVLKDFETYRNQTISVEGKVEQVCQEKGCWIKIEDQHISVRAIMKGHSFKVPQELKSKRVKMTGVMEQKELPVKVVRHYMKDEGRTAEEIKRVTAPQKVFQFVVDGVQEL